MYDRILFPTDGSEGAFDSLGHALDMAENHSANLHLLNVAETTMNRVVRL